MLTIENITRNIEEETRRNQVLHALTEGSRASLGSIRAAVTNLIDYPDMEPEMRERFLGVVGDEVAGMSQRLDRTMVDFSDSMKMRWPLEDILGIDLILAAQRRIEEKLQLPTKTEGLDNALWVKAESFSLVFALLFLASRLQDHYKPRELRFRLAAEGKLAYLDLIWAGPAMSSETFYTWEMESMRVGVETSQLTVRDVIDRHGGEIWYQREKAAHRAYFRFVLPVATPEIEEQQEDNKRGAGRPESVSYTHLDVYKRQARRRQRADRRGQGVGRGREEPARRTDVGTGAGRGRLQPRRTHSALQQPRPAPVQGAGAGADLGVRGCPDRPRALDFLDSGEESGADCRGRRPPAAGGRQDLSLIHI